MGTTTQIGPNGEEITTQFIYDPAGRLSVTIDPAGIWREANRLTAGADYVSDPADPAFDASVWQSISVYDADGHLLTTTDVLGHATSYGGYDRFGNPQTITDALGRTTTNQYNDKGRLTQTTDATGVTTHYSYNVKGLPFRITDGEGNLRGEFKYNSKGNLTETIAADGQRQYFVYDALGHQTLSYYVWTNPLDPDDKATVVSRTVYDGEYRVTGTEQYVIEGEHSFTSGAQLDEYASSRTQSPTTTYNAAGQVISTRDEHDRLVETVYDVRGLPIETRQHVEDADGNPVVLLTRTVYDAGGRAVLVTDPYIEGDTILATESIYDGIGRATTTRHLRGITVAVSGTGQSLSSSWAMGSGSVLSTSETIYDAYGGILRNSDSLGNDVRYVYDAAGRVIETRTLSRDEQGISVWLVGRTVYDALGRMKATTDNYVDVAALESISGTLHEYDAAGRQTATRRVQGLEISVSSSASSVLSTGIVVTGTETYYDAQGRKATTVAVNDPGAASDDARTDYYYDAYGRQRAMLGPVINAAGYSQPIRMLTEFVYDTAGQQSRATTGIIVPNTTANFAGRVDLATAPLNSSAARTTYYEYDALHQRTAVVSPPITDPDNPAMTTHARTETVYDDLGQIVGLRDNIKQNDPLNPATIEAAGVRETIYQNDAFGRLAAVELPEVPDPQNGGQPTRPRYEYKYDAFDNLVSVIDPLSHETQITFDSQGNQSSRTLPIGVAATSDPTDFVERRFYDNLGHLDYEISFEGVYTRYGYDSVGRVITKEYFENATVWSNGAGAPQQTTIYTYDAFGRVFRTEQDTNGTPATIERTVTNAYNPLGQLVSVVSPEGTLHYEYDQHSGLLRRIYTGAEVGEQPSISGDGKAITDTRYTYDPIGRLVTVAIVERNDALVVPAEITSYQYDIVGNLAKETLPNGVVRSYQYDLSNRLTLLDEFFDSNADGDYDVGVDTLLAQYDYDLLLDGTRSGVTEELRVNGVIEETRIDWVYDRLGRLVRESYNSFDDALDFIADYTLDLAGNRLAKKTDTDPTFVGDPSYDETIDYEYDANDRLLSEFKNATGTANDTTTLYEYGPNADPVNGAGGDYTVQTRKTVWEGTDTDPQTGVMRSDTSYAYDLQGRLSEVQVDTDGDGDFDDTTLYEYADDGTRVSETVDGVKTIYVVDKQNPTGYSQVLEEKNTSGTVTKTYTLGLSVIAQQAVSGGGTLYLMRDGHGSARGLLDATGQPLPTEIYRYDAFGNAIGFNPALAMTSRLYNSEPFNGSTGFYDFRARPYDPRTGRFPSLDPIFGDPNAPQTLHKYLFGIGNPVSFSDPTGLYPGFPWPVLYPGYQLADEIQLPVLGTLVHSFFGRRFKEWAGARELVSWANQENRTIVKRLTNVPFPLRGNIVSSPISLVGHRDNQSSTCTN